MEKLDGNLVEARVSLVPHCITNSKILVGSPGYRTTSTRQAQALNPLLVADLLPFNREKGTNSKLPQIAKWCGGAAITDLLDGSRSGEYYIPVRLALTLYSRYL